MVDVEAGASVHGLATGELVAVGLDLNYPIFP
jgi:hypothetical protein